MNKSVLFLSTLLLMAGSAAGQLINGNAFLQGQYLELGMNQCGGWGTTSDAPAGYHARSGSNTPANGNGPLSLGIVADPDKNGWTSGFPNKYQGDYFMPASPWSGWSVAFNNGQYGSERTGTINTGCNGLNGMMSPFPGNIVSVTTSGNKTVATWMGYASGLELKKIVTLKTNQLYFTVQVVVKNTTNQTMNDIYYGEYINPDNDAYYQDVYSGNIGTYNTIASQNPVDGKAVVKTEGELTGAYLALGSKDCRSKVFRGMPGYLIAPLGPSTWYTGAGSLSLSGGDTSATNSFIGISFNIGALAANDSTSVTYAYYLQAADSAIALDETGPGIRFNGTAYGSGATVHPCSGSTSTLSLTNADFYTWSWSPATSLSATTGNTVSVTAGNFPVTYTATGVGACGQKSVSVTIDPIPSPTPGVGVTANPSNVICNGTPVTFNAAPAYGGVSPTYQWKVNGVNLGGNTPAFTPANLQNGDSVSVVMTTSLTTCIAATTAASVPVTMTVNQPVVPGININVGAPISICPGASETFYTNIVGGGTNPQYLWLKNGMPVGTNAPTYTDNTLLNADTISVVMTSNENCVSTPFVPSNKVGITVNPQVTPAVTVTSSTNHILNPGQYVTFTANVVNGGPTPGYQWKRNGVNIPLEIYSTYTTNNLQPGDIISVAVQSSAPCALTTMVLSDGFRMEEVSGIPVAGNWKGAFSLYPNPTNGRFTINATSEAGRNVRITILDAVGRIIYHTEVQPDRTSWSLPVQLNQSLPAGTYQLRLQTADQQAVKPFTIVY